MSSKDSQASPSGAFKRDLLASVVVFLVALPLCMGVAIASGVPVAAGLMTGIIGGLVVGYFAGCPLQVSGPAAGLTVVIYEFVREFGLEMLGIVVLIAGAVQLLAGLLKLGQWFRAVSPAVIQGMLAGIGVLIFASQFHVMMDDKPKGSGWQNLVSIPDAIFKGLTWQTPGSVEDRQFRTHALRNVGELHRRQELVAEHVAEQLPDHSTPAQLAAETPAQIAAEAAALALVKPEQAAITERLQTFVVELEAFVGKNTPLSEEDRKTQAHVRTKAALVAARAALAAAQEAEADLKSGKVRHAMVSQNEATKSLTELNETLTNHSLAAQLGLLTIVSIVLWQAFGPKRLKMVPGPLVAVVVATTLAALFTIPVLFVEVPSNLWEEIHFPTWTVLQDAPWLGLLKAALVIAVVASAETLLCATAVDQMQTGPRTKYDQELAAQGIGNMLCGLVGALPMTGVIVRSSANVQAGGKTRRSAMLHGLWLLLFVVFLSALLRLIPTSALAAILVFTGYKLCSPKSIKQLKAYGWGEVAVYLVTVVMIVVTDLLTGVLSGICLSAAMLLYRFSYLKANLKVEQERAVLSMTGAATFLRLPVLASELERVPPGAELHVDFQQLEYIDHACIDLLMNWATQHEASGGKLVIDWDKLHACFRSGNGETNGNGVHQVDANGTITLKQDRPKQLSH